MNKEKIIKAGKIAAEVKSWIRPQIKKDMPLIGIAEKIESKIFELGGKPAFPVNLSIDNIAAHYTPSHEDKILARGLLKVDFGVHVDGWTSDNAFSVDLENNEENKKIIKASEDALENAIKLIKEKIVNNKKLSDESGEDGKGIKNQLKLNEIGGKIQETIESRGFSPVINLSGHSMSEWELHSGTTIPNINDKKNISLKPGLYAIEPFATTGSGKVHDGKPSGIYSLINEKNVRSPLAREILKFIIKEYRTLPFCSRWIVKKFGTRALIGLKQLEDNGNLHHFPQLLEKNSGKKIKISQSEETILIDEDGNVIVTTR